MTPTPDTETDPTLRARRARLFELFRQQANSAQAGALPPGAGAEQETQAAMDALRQRAVNSLARTA